MINALTAEDGHMLKTMKEQEMSLSEIARRTGVSRKTVRKYITMEKPVKYSRKWRQSVIAPYTDYVRGELTSIASLLPGNMKRSEKKVISCHTQLSRGYAGSCVKIAVYRQNTAMRRNEKKFRMDFGEFSDMEINGKRKNIYEFSMVMKYSEMW